MKYNAMKNIISLSLPLLLVSMAWKNPYSDCKDLIRLAYKRMNDLGETVPSGKTYHLDYTVEAKLRQRPNQAGKEQFNVFMNENQMVLLSERMDFYGDRIHTFKIIHDAKRIYWGDSDFGLGGKQRMKGAFMFRDSLLQLSDVTSCAPEKNNSGEQLKKITLTCTPRGLQLLNYKQVTFWIDENSLSAKRITMLFGKMGEMESVDYTFNKIHLDHQGSEIPVSIKKYLLDTGNKPKGRYKGYALIDTRHKK